jgi:hypothetical protein
MLPGASEAATIAKVGGSVLQGLQKANKPLPWPDTREALLELYAILDDWCMRASKTTAYVEKRLLDRKRDRLAKEKDSHHDPAERPDYSGPDKGQTVFGGGNIIQTSDYSITMMRDIGEIIDPKAPLLKRWQASSRRKAARQSLRTILSAYSPELLRQFELAVQARANWIQEYERAFDRWFDYHTEEDGAQVVSEMHTTLSGLTNSRDKLRDFIIANFPLSDRR